jgi:hypothetical protein
VGVALALCGIVVYAKGKQWAGTILLIIAFSEIIYWTTPTFLGGGIQEFNRLVTYKLALSILSILLWGAAVRTLRVFDEHHASAVRPTTPSL